MLETLFLLFYLLLQFLNLSPKERMELMVQFFAKLQFFKQLLKSLVIGEEVHLDALIYWDLAMKD